MGLSHMLLFAFHPFTRVGGVVKGRLDTGRIISVQQVLNQDICAAPFARLKVVDG